MPMWSPRAGAHRRSIRPRWRSCNPGRWRSRPRSSRGFSPRAVRCSSTPGPTAALIDARDAEEFRSDSLPRSRNLPRSKVLPGKDVGEVKAAKDDGRLPMEDHNTRIVVYGRDARQARAVAEAITREAFHNVSYFEGSYESLKGELGRAR